MTALMQTILAVVGNMLLGALCSILGLILNKILQKIGVIRDKQIYIFIGCSLGLPIASVAFPQLPLWLSMVIVSLAVPSGAIRGDLWRTSKYGRWWWKDSKSQKE